MLFKYVHVTAAYVIIEHSDSESHIGYDKKKIKNILHVVICISLLQYLKIYIGLCYRDDNDLKKTN